MQTKTLEGSFQFQPNLESPPQKVSEASLQVWTILDQRGVLNVLMDISKYCLTRAESCRVRKLEDLEGDWEDTAESIDDILPFIPREKE